MTRADEAGRPVCRWAPRRTGRALGRVGLVALLGLLGVAGCVAQDPAGPAVTIGAGPTWLPTVSPPARADFGDPLAEVSVTPRPGGLPTRAWTTAELDAVLPVAADLPGTWSQRTLPPTPPATDGPQSLDENCRAAYADLDALIARIRPTMTTRQYRKGPRTLSVAVGTKPGTDQGERLARVRRVASSCAYSQMRGADGLRFWVRIRPIEVPGIADVVAVEQVLTDRSETYYQLSAYLPAGPNVISVQYQKDTEIGDKAAIALLTTIHNRALTVLGAPAR